MLRIRSPLGHGEPKIRILLLCFLPVIATFVMTYIFSEEMKRFVQQTAQDWLVPAISVAIVSSRGSTGTIERTSKEPSKSASCSFVALVGGFCFPNGTTNISSQAFGGETDSQSIDKDTLFPLASLTKLFTAVSVGILVEGGKLAWSTKIKDILPEFRMVDEAMAERLTVEMILSHQSELYGHMCAGTGAHQESSDVLEIIAGLRMRQPRKDGQSCTSYNNHGYMVLRLVIERLSGVPYSRFVQERILQPLKMQRTTFHQGRLSEAGSNCVNAAVVDPELVTSGEDCKYGATESSVRWFVHAQASSEDREEADIEEKHGLPGEAAWLPAGGLLSSASDMLHDARLEGEVLENPEIARNTGEGSYRRVLQEVLKPKIKADWQLIFGVPTPGEAAYPEFTGVEYGLRVQVFCYRGLPIACHTGSIPGTGAVLLWTPHRKQGESFGIYVNTNVMAQGLAVSLVIALRALDLEFGLEPIDWAGRTQKAPGLWELRKAPHMPDRLANGKPALKGGIHGGYNAAAYGRLQLHLAETPVPALHPDHTKLLKRIRSAEPFGPSAAEPDYYAWLMDGKPIWTSYFAVFHISQRVLWAEEHILARSSELVSTDDAAKASWIDVTHATTHAPGSNGYIWVLRSLGGLDEEAEVIDWYRSWPSDCHDLEAELDPEQAEVRFRRDLQ